MTQLTSDHFKQQAKSALHNTNLQHALQKLNKGFVQKRALAVEQLPQFEEMRDEAVRIKNHTLQYLDYYLTEFEKNVIQNGGEVHWAKDAAHACQIIVDLAKKQNAKLVTKGKTMVGEEIGINHALKKAGLTVIETDLGEYIIQLREDAPSHIVAPAIHVLQNEVAKSFYETHLTLDAKRDLSQPEQLLNEARTVLRENFLAADIGITGANFLIAENGSTVIVTNEGNGDLTQTCAKTHIVIASIEKVVPTVEDSFKLLRLLGRSATGQAITSYVTFSNGIKRPADLEGPDAFHVVLVDNHRTHMLGSEFQDMLRCIRCGACLNHCPIYQAIGGQAYGSVYPGPMGAVLSPSLFGLEKTKDLPNASTFCGRCEAVCPMRIPLPKMMRHYREQEFQKKLSAKKSRLALKIWAYLAKRPSLYHKLMQIIIYILGKKGKKVGAFSYLPFATAFTQYRDFPAPTGHTFQSIWQKKLKEQKT